MLSTGALEVAARGLTARYRDGATVEQRSFLHDALDVRAYASYRVPATYGAVRNALYHLCRAVPDLQPRSLLDAGAGPGTASWAAAEAFSSLESVLLIERDPNMISLGNRLQRGLSGRTMRSWLRADLMSHVDFPAADLVLASYALGELTPGQQIEVTRKLWTATREALVIVEPGTPRGYEVMVRARSELLAEGASVAAPCPHDAECPMRGHDWCHFSARVGRSAIHRRIKEAELAYEDEKFSYVALLRGPTPERWSRVVRHPQIRPGLIRLALCTDQGLEDETVGRRRREEFKAARKTKWGDRWRFTH